MVAAQLPIQRRAAPAPYADAVRGKGRAVLSGRRGGAGGGVNVGDLERLASLTGGGLLALFGLCRGSLAGLGLAALGCGLVYRGLSRLCPAYCALDISRAEKHSPQASVAAGAGVKVVRAVTVNRPAEELYRQWRNLEGLPRIMSHLVSVKVNGKKSHWIARAPAGTTVAWDAEVITDEPGRLISWRSLEGSEVSIAGSVLFTELPADRGTEVKVTLKYDPPAGKLGSWLAWLFGQEPGLQIREDLRRFKWQTEAGEIPTAEGQPSGRR